MAEDPLLSRIEDAGLNASAPAEQRWLDGWLLRFSPGKAKRARCINAVAEGRLPLDERLALAAEAYREAGLPLILRITPFTRPAGLEDAVAALGWRSLDDTRVMVCRDFSATTAPDLHPEPADAATYAEVVGALRGSPAAQRAAHARRLQTSPVPYRGYVVREGARVLACGQFAREAELVGLYDVFVAPEARGRGLARRLCTWLLAQAAGEGARHAYLQVEGDNTPARAVYHRLGFTDAYAYHYRTPETGTV
ncbi:MAG: GNAT family N-acetyltransferase [Rubrivivax sp.]